MREKRIVAQLAVCCLVLAGCEAASVPGPPVKQGVDFAALAAQVKSRPLPAADGTQAAPESPARAELLKRYWAADFDWLEARLGEQQAALANPVAREAAVRHINRLVTRITAAPRAFEIAERWREAKPKSYCAHTVLGRAYMEEAWRARGSKYASETSPEGFAEMARWRAGASARCWCSRRR